MPLTKSPANAPGGAGRSRPSSPAGGKPDPALTLRLLDTQERRAVGRRDWSDANRVLAQRLRLKAQILAPRAGVQGATL